jgi:uncharacterized protein (TIGR00255 family)
MLSSMTGFGRFVGDTPCGKLVVEIQSVNRKHLETSVQLPKEWSRFESEVRKWIGDQLSRGHVTVRVFLSSRADSLPSLLPDRTLLEALKKGWDQLAIGVGMSPSAVDLPFLVSQLPEREAAQKEREEDLSVLQQGVKEALKCLVEMRQIEGKVLSADLSHRLKELASHLPAIEKLSPEVVQRMRQKLKEKITEALGNDAALEERLLREVVIFAEKVDISEEITRLRSHFAQFADLLQTKTPAMGRKMDFLVQEIGREINTLGAKCAEAKITAHVVDMKTELEKMREQIQNIE